MKNSASFKRLISLVFLFLLVLGSYAQKIHFIMVIMDAPGSRVDKEKMTTEVEKIGRACNMTVEKYIYTREQENEYKSKINSLSASSDDVIWFYYSGHGSNSGNGWPTFGNNVQETYVHEKLKSKNARLTVTMYDCCNQGQTTTTYTPATKTLAPDIAYALMFKKSKGDVMICSSSDNLYSFGSEATGGAFSSSFIFAMSNISLSSSEEQKRIWYNVRDLATTNTNAMCVQNNWVNRNQRKEQNPKFQINLITESTATHNAPDHVTAGEYDSFLGKKFLLLLKVSMNW